jgi:hypothetical protein
VATVQLRRRSEELAARAETHGDSKDADRAFFPVGGLSGQIAEIWHPGLVMALQLALGYQLVPPTGAAVATPTA